jgi:hypothetical protein
VFLKVLKLPAATIWTAAAFFTMLSFILSPVMVRAQTLHSLTPAAAASEAANANSAASTPTIVIGFVGGMVSHENSAHSEVQLAQKLRKEYSSGVYVEAFENRRRDDARKTILRLLDRDRDGKLSAEEKEQARVILYGHSWGAAAVVALARELQQEGIPVLLTAQVDSISKNGIDDALIPANVERAVNFYQPDGLLHGRPEIRAADPAHTKILGNYRMSYKDTPYDCKGYPWYDRVFSKTHTLIECDTNVWSQVENLIRGQLDPVAAEQKSTK